jgi:hypothetical protein
MSITKVTRSITLAAILMTYLSSTIAIAEPDQQSGKRHGPPPQAFEVCAEQTEGATCSFPGRRGDVTGSCIIPPRGEAELVCAPEGGPPRDHGEEQNRG